MKALSLPICAGLMLCASSPVTLDVYARDGSPGRTRPTLPMLASFAGDGVATASAGSSLQVVAFAGTGKAGFSGDNGPATRAQLNNPYGLCRGPDGALYICDMDNQRVRRVAPDGTISTVAGTGKRGYSGDGGLALAAELNEPYEVRFDNEGNLFFVERLNHLVRRVDAKTRVISTIAGRGTPGFSGDGGPATNAVFNQPHSIQFDAKGDLYICDIGNDRIRKVDMKTGMISTFAGSGRKEPTPDGAPISGSDLNGPRAIDFDQDGNLWVALREGNAVYRLDLRARVIHHIAGTGKTGFSGNGGPAIEAMLSGPKGICVAPNGNIFLTDTESHSVRMIDVSTKKLELIAGTGDPGDGPEGNPLRYRLTRPHGIFVDKDGTVFVGDSEAHRVLAIRRGP